MNRTSPGPLLYFAKVGGNLVQRQKCRGGIAALGGGDKLIALLAGVTALIDRREHGTCRPLDVILSMPCNRQVADAAKRRGGLIGRRSLTGRRGRRLVLCRRQRAE